MTTPLENTQFEYDRIKENGPKDVYDMAFVAIYDYAIKLENRLIAIECGECGKNLLECECE